MLLVLLLEGGTGGRHGPGGGSARLGKDKRTTDKDIVEVETELEVGARTKGRGGACRVLHVRAEGGPPDAELLADVDDALKVGRLEVLGTAAEEGDGVGDVAQAEGHVDQGRHVAEEGDLVVLSEFGEIFGEIGVYLGWGD